METIACTVSCTCTTGKRECSRRESGLNAGESGQDV